MDGSILQWFGASATQWPMGYSRHLLPRYPIIRQVLMPRSDARAATVLDDHVVEEKGHFLKGNTALGININATEAMRGIRGRTDEVPPGGGAIFPTLGRSAREGISFSGSSVLTEYTVSHFCLKQGRPRKSWLLGPYPNSS